MKKGLEFELNVEMFENRITSLLEEGKVFNKKRGDLDSLYLAIVNEEENEPMPLFIHDTPVLSSSEQKDMNLNTTLINSTLSELKTSEDVIDKAYEKVILEAKQRMESMKQTEHFENTRNESIEIENDDFNDYNLRNKSDSNFNFFETDYRTFKSFATTEIYTLKNTVNNLIHGNEYEIKHLRNENEKLRKEIEESRSMVNTLLKNCM